MTVAAIVATDLHNAIGKNNQLLWHLPADLKFFKQTTMGCPVIMGRKTYESIGRLLPGRKNIIITRSSDYRVNGAEIYHSLETALAACKNDPATEKVFIIGGAEIFKQSFHLTNEIFRTVVEATFEADTFIPAIDEKEFSLTWEECHTADEKNKFDYCFQKWVRVK
jgi:dihydrofolate reductase